MRTCHHVFAFTGDGRWAVVQQGMDQTSVWARRYHWLWDKLDSFVEEPHSAVCGEPAQAVLNMVALEKRAKTGDNDNLKALKRLASLSTLI
ncbi:MAG: DUF763 domain-containing protein [Desulfotomaculaceae bacterium]|nr:DUF763 domain-containing protein [Desulfotomaculaceae bacterium]